MCLRSSERPICQESCGRNPKPHCEGTAGGLGVSDPTSPYETCMPDAYGKYEYAALRHMHIDLHARTAAVILES